MSWEYKKCFHCLVTEANYSHQMQNILGVGEEGEEEEGKSNRKLNVERSI